MEERQERKQKILRTDSQKSMGGKEKNWKICIFFAKRDGDFVGALCAFSILFPTIPSRSAVSAHTLNAAEQKA